MPSLLTCWLNFLSLFSKVQFCLYCLTLSRYFFRLSFTNIFWFISSNWVVRLVCDCLWGDLFISVSVLSVLSSMAVSRLLSLFLYLSFYSHFPSGFCILARILLWNANVLRDLVSHLHWWTRSVPWCCPLGCFNNSFTFSVSILTFFSSFNPLEMVMKSSVHSGFLKNQFNIFSVLC